MYEIIRHSLMILIHAKVYCLQAKGLFVSIVHTCIVFIVNTRIKFVSFKI